MRYTVDLAELAAGAEHLREVLRAKGFGVAHRLDPVARAVRGGVTSAVLEGVLQRWRGMERRAWDGVAEHAGHLTATVEAYAEVEARAVEALGDPP